MDDFLLFVGMPGVYQTTRPKTGYKKIYCSKYRDALSIEFSAIAELEIPTDSIIVKTTTSKLRTNQAIVKSIKSISDDAVIDETCVCYSIWDNSFMYRTGKTVYPRGELNIDSNDPCGSGINFFNSEEKAKNYKNF
nr:pentapeptide repeat containing protein [Mimivirus sp.]